MPFFSRTQWSTWATASTAKESTQQMAKCKQSSTSQFPGMSVNSAHSWGRSTTIPSLCQTCPPFWPLFTNSSGRGNGGTGLTPATQAKVTEAPVLAHYDPTLPLTLAADASQYGVGAHTMADSTERPIAYTSRTLNKAECNYAQVEKEALSRVNKFHQYLYGRKFTLITDHKPLTTILGPKRGIPPLAAARMQRWGLVLATTLYDPWSVAYVDGLDFLTCSVDLLTEFPK